MTNRTIPANVIDKACRTDYENRYHKIEADLGYESYSRIWGKAVQFALSQVADQDHIEDLRALVADAQVILAKNALPSGVSDGETVIALLDLLDGPRSRAVIVAPAKDAA